MVVKWFDRLGANTGLRPRLPFVTSHNCTNCKGRMDFTHLCSVLATDRPTIDRAFEMLASRAAKD